MDIDFIKALAELVKANGLKRLSVSEGETHIEIEAPFGDAPIVAAPTPPITEGVDPGLDFNDIHTVNSPMVGVFYQAPGPGESPYVQVGQRIKKGDVLCIVEAMKLMNEILAERDGEVVDICVSDGDVVEYGQTLFKIF